MEWSSCKVAKRQGETTPMRHANSTTNSTLKILKTPRFAWNFFRPGNLNLRQNWCPTQVPEASQVYLRLELAIYFRCKKCQFFQPNCFGWWEAPLILGFIWCGSSVCVSSCFGNYAKHRQYDAHHPLLHPRQTYPKKMVFTINGVSWFP